MMTKPQTKCLATIGFALLAAAANAQIIPERPVSAPLYRPAALDQHLPSVATDGTDFLAVWHDERAGVGQPSEFYAARISAAGELLDPTGIRLGPFGWQPAVVFAGDAYAVFWTSGAVISVVRISRDGQIIDGPRIVAAGVDPYFPYSAASNGRRIVLAGQLHLLILDDHAVLLERVAPLSTAFPVGWPPVVATNGSTFLVVWGISLNDFTTVVMPLDAEGHPSAPARRAGAFGFYPKIASDGHDYLVVVPHQPNVATAFAVSAAGEPSAPQTLSIVEPLAAGWDGSEYAVLVRATPSSVFPQVISALRLDRTAAPLDSAPVKFAQMNAVGGTVVTASAGGRLLAVYDGRKNDTDDSSDIRASLADTGQLASAKELLVAQSAAAQRAPLIASSGNTFLVVWSEGVTSLMNLFSRDGTPRFAQPVKLPLFARALVFDGTNYVILAAAYPNFNAFAMRVAPDSGALLDPQGVRISTDSVAGAGSDGAGTLLVTTSALGNAATRTMVTRLDPSLAVTGSVLVSSDYATQASVAWDGTEWLVAYEKPVASLIPEITRSDVRAVRVSPGLTPLDPTPIAFAEPSDNSRPIAVSDGDGFAVFWTDNFAAGTKGRRIGRDGNPLGTAVLIGRASLYDALWDGSRFALAITGTETFIAHASAGLLPVGDVTLLASDPALTPVLTRSGRAIVAAYARRGFEPIYGGVYRVFFRTPPPAASHTRAAGR